MTANLRRAAGSLLVVGLGGHELTTLERAWLKLIRPGGVILFRRNIADARQTRALLRDATQFCAPHSLRCVDVEGGTVDRLRDALAPMPSAQAVAQKAAQTGNPALGREHGSLIARAVKAFGFNATLAPVLDLALPPSAQVMGTRAAAPDGEGVTQYARNFLAGLAEEHIAGCGKHFPGLGAGALDSHTETPAIRRNLRDLWRDDLLPYRALHAQLPMVMVGHASYPETPGRNRPASVSPYWIGSVLRRRIGYRGLILSDDLEMGGIRNFLPIGDAAIAAIRAGIHLVEICHSPELILTAYEALLSEAERSPAFRTLLVARARESSSKRAKLFRAPIAPALSVRQLKALRNRIVAFRETVNEAPATAASVASQISQSANMAETA
jgi:beta-N-acetylhexosaminidase